MTTAPLDCLEISQVDAFTQTRYGGNPCAVVLDADNLSEESMQTIAREMNLSETAFVLQSETADVRARYFTPTAEIPLAGHPTLATMQTLLNHDRLPAADALQVSLELQAGEVEVEIMRDEQGRHRITMAQNKPEFLQAYDWEDVKKVFGFADEDVLEQHTPATVSTGTPQLMVPLRSLDALKRARIDAGRFESLLKPADFFSIHLFVPDAGNGATFARHFAPPPEIFEDPFTGSATGGMAAYLWRYGLLKTPSFVARQGDWMQRPGEALVEVVGPPRDIETVKVGGYAVEVMRGEILVPG